MKSLKAVREAHLQTLMSERVTTKNDRRGHEKGKLQRLKFPASSKKE